jgi:type I restriction enzyme M protein
VFANIIDIENRLWDIADGLRANTHLRASEYSVPVLGLIFLKFATEKFKKIDRELQAIRPAGSRRELGPSAYKARGALYLEPEATLDHLLSLREGEDIGSAINSAMVRIELHNEDLKGSLPTNSYGRIDDKDLIPLLRTFDSIPFDPDAADDPFGRIYEYFLSKFALKEGQHGGEFFTPTSLVRLIVEIIEPFQGLILDPACGSGGMFVQSAQFVQRHQNDPVQKVSIYGQEKTLETVRLCKMNLAVRGLPGDVQDANSYYEDRYQSVGRFDFVMANPPFNVNGVDRERIKGDTHRFPFGIPRVDNGNYLWIQLFYSALNEHGRAGFVMPNSASDARGSELDIRRSIIKEHVVDVMISIGSNFFYTVTLPCALWFFDKEKREGSRREQILFIDARPIYQQVDRAHREFKPEQLEFLANIVRLYRGEAPETTNGSEALLQEHFPTGTYADIAGLCKVATLEDIEAQGWSLNPGRYVGVAERVVEDFDFKEKLETLHEELVVLNVEAHDLEERISENVAKLLEGKM